MFSKGQIIYCTPFYFQNGNTAKPKYFIILSNINEETIIASLPTRTNNAPSLIEITHGCVNHDDRCFNCYVFEPNRKISHNGFSFPIRTYIYGNEVESYKLALLSSIYTIENIDYEILGTLTDDEFINLYDCIKNSGSVKRGIKRLL